MLTLLLATRNRKKAAELQRLMDGTHLRFMTLANFPDIPPIKENGSTFRANAAKKAVAASRHTILPVLAEDSGLQVRTLRGRPGVRSARFAGKAQDDRANNAKLLKVMASVPVSRREARFVCCLALAAGGRLIRTFQTDCPGSIALQQAGRTGFGYDPLFVPRGYRQTMAQLGYGVKHRLSHRAKAVAQLKRWLRQERLVR